MLPTKNTAPGSHNILLKIVVLQKKCTCFLSFCHFRIAAKIFYYSYCLRFIFNTPSKKLNLFFDNSKQRLFSKPNQMLPQEIKSTNHFVKIFKYPLRFSCKLLNVSNFSKAIERGKRSRNHDFHSGARL